MIITRSPLRISIAGGGTDLPSYYRENEGFLISAAIDKYVFVTITRPFSPGIYIKYSQIEHINKIQGVQHPIIREGLELFNKENELPQIEITTLADIPAGTGLGSSGSFTTALIKGLYTYEKQLITTYDLAELACDIEINKLSEPIGKQDQYIAAHGGITCFTFHKDDKVTVQPLKISSDTINDLEDHLLLFFTGFSRSASNVLRDQKEKTISNNNEMLSNLHYVKELGYRAKELLENGNTSEFGELMHEHWLHKKNRSSGMSNNKIDEWYEIGLKNGAIGGKLVGAGGGGFLLFYADDKKKLRKAMREEGLEEVRFKFDFEGTKVILS
jgi:D-glycero-alpha-D-manno-heptose-7-phosphate kinase